MKQIYILNTCDEWKECGSMFSVAVSLSITRIKKLILQLTKKSDMTYMGRCPVANPTKDMLMKMFQENFRLIWKAESGSNVGGSV